MNTPIPFLYLPDAISIALLVAVLVLLRRLGLEHFRQELIKVRNKLVLACCDAGFPLDHPACLYIHDEIASLERIAEKISPANLLYVRRIWKEISKGDPANVLSYMPDPLGQKLARIENARIAEKLFITQIEINLTLGSLYLLGSLSGWAVASRFLYKIALRKIPGDARKKLDKRMDLAERLISFIGYKVLVLLSLKTKAVIPLVPSTDALVSQQ
jgi:hypothetical protein